jgi:DNA-binding CsgD family transcriptional regulator
MGKISNLITDMTLKGATQKEIARAVKHSMVVIDAVKHNLDYKQSYKDNGIAILHNKYQPKDDPNKKGGGASTLISKASSQKRVPERKEGAFFAKDTGNRLTLIDNEKKLYFDEKTNRVYTQKEKKTLYIDPKTGEKLYRETGRTYNTVRYTTSSGKTKKSSIYILKDGKYKVPKKNLTLIKDNKLYFKDENGEYTQVTTENIKTKKAMSITTKMADVKDAYTLSSGTTQEEAYASYANKLKSLANDARKEFLIIKDIPYSSSARKTYLVEVESLNHKLNQALLNAPKERRAQTIAASIIRSKLQENPSLTKEQEKKLKQQELSRARFKVGAKRQEVKITEKEWEAIQAGAISHTKLSKIIANADLDILRQLAMPRKQTSLSPNKLRRLENMAAAGYTTSEIAKALGISPSTVTKYLKGDAS